jgi:hypothetical protein
MLIKLHGLNSSPIVVVGLVVANKRCISEIASSPRLSSNLRGASLFILLLYTLSGSGNE